jgi:alpha/beta superfamily hydrolase
MGHDLAPADAAWATAVLLHPHPDYGGDRHNVVIDALYQRLPTAGISCFRFDFGTSAVDDARDEAIAALDQVTALNGLPAFLIGYSFGADIACACTDERIVAWCLVAPPLRFGPAVPAVASDPRPKLVLVAEHDQFNPPSRAAPALEAWTNTTVDMVAGADHFMIGSSAAAAERCRSFLSLNRA